MIKKFQMNSSGLTSSHVATNAWTQTPGVCIFAILFCSVKPFCFPWRDRVQLWITPGFCLVCLVLFSRVSSLLSGAVDFPEWLLMLNPRKLLPERILDNKHCLISSEDQECKKKKVTVKITENCMNQGWREMASWFMHTDCFGRRPKFNS